MNALRPPLAISISNNRIIFVHVPRTGGTSLNWLIRDSVGRKAIKKIKSYAPFNVGWYEGDWRYMIGHMNFPPPQSLPEDVIILTILRNPVDRIVSWFKYFMVSRANQREGIDPSIRNTPTEYRDMLCEFAQLEHNRNQQAKILAGVFSGVSPASAENDHFEDTELIARALKNLEQSCAIVGTTENYSNYLEFLTRKLCLKNQDEPIKRGDTSHIEVGLDEECRKIILAANQADFVVWEKFSKLPLAP